MSDYKIEKAVPLPTPGVQPTKYPFAQMAVGDSFHVPIRDAAPSTVQQAAYLFSARNREFKFNTRRDGSGTRIWRVAVPIPAKP